MLSAFVFIVCWSCFRFAAGIKSPSGISIPQSVIERTLPAFNREPHKLSHNLYDLSIDDEQLRTPDGSIIHLRNLTYTRTIEIHPELKVYMNGRNIGPLSSNIREYSSSDKLYSVVFTEGDSAPIVIRGDRLNLQVIHSTSSHHVLAQVDKPKLHTSSASSVAQFEDHVVKVDIPETMRQRRTTCSRSNPHNIEIAMGFDGRFCALYGSTSFRAIAAIQVLVDEADKSFRKSTCLRVSLVHIEGYCSSKSDPKKDRDDPYFHILDGVKKEDEPAVEVILRWRQFFSNNRRGVHRDVAYFVSEPGAFESEDSSARVYYGLCLDSSYGVIENNPNLLAHMLLISMRAASAQTGLGSYKFRTENFFEKKTLTEIDGFVNNGFANSSCITANTPKCESSCLSNTCSTKGGKCVAPVRPPKGFTSCKFVQDAVYCTKARAIGRGQTIYLPTKCPSNWVEVAYDSSDPFIQCCTNSVAGTANSVSKRDHVLKIFFFGLNIFRNAITLRRGSATDVSPWKGTYLRTNSLSCFSATKPTPKPKPTKKPRRTPPVAPKPQLKLCGDAFSPSAHLSCVEVEKKVISMGKMGAVDVEVRIRLGTVFCKVIVGKPSGVLIRIKLENGPENSKFQQRLTRGEVSMLYNTQITELKIPSGKFSCCGDRRLTLILSITICRGVDCEVKVDTMKLKNICRPICPSGTSPLATPLPMSKTRTCPMCI